MPAGLRSSACMVASTLLLSASETPCRAPLANVNRAHFTVDTNDDVRIENMNAEGCYLGRSELKGASFVRAGENAFTEYCGRACRFYFSFRPEEGCVPEASANARPAALQRCCRVGHHHE